MYNNVQSDIARRRSYNRNAYGDSRSSQDILPFSDQVAKSAKMAWLHWMNFYTTVSDDDLFKRFLFDGEKKRRCYIASILRETRTRKVIESLDEFSFFYRRVEKYLLLNSFCTHNTGQRVSKDQFRNSDNIVECRKARLPRFCSSDIYILRLLFTYSLKTISIEKKLINVFSEIIFIDIRNRINVEKNVGCFKVESNFVIFIVSTSFSPFVNISIFIF